MLKGYRTIILNVAALVFGVIAMLYPQAELPSIDDVDGLITQVDGILVSSQGLVVSVLAFVNLILRAVTTTPVFRRDDKPKE